MSFLLNIPFAVQFGISVFRLVALHLYTLALRYLQLATMDAEQPPSTTQPSTILNEDPFRNENTQRLFEAIDELRSCGANQEIGLPEVGNLVVNCNSTYWTAFPLACDRGRSIRWEVVTLTKFDRHSLSCRRSAVYKVSDTHRL